MAPHGAVDKRRELAGSERPQGTRPDGGALLQAIGRGADGILFFQWRQSRTGSEKFHSAMLPHAGTATRTWREVTALGEMLAALPPLTGGSGARIGLVFDWENGWAVSGSDHPIVLDYAALVQR